MLVAALLLAASVSASANERLVLTALPFGQTRIQFQFSSTGDISSSHFAHLPRTLITLLGKYNVDELHLSLSRGRYDYQRWGNAPKNHPNLGNGALVTAWISPDHTRSVLEHWKGFVQGLGGLYCASLGSLADQGIQPAFALHPQGNGTHNARVRVSIHS